MKLKITVKKLKSMFFDNNNLHAILFENKITNSEITYELSKMDQDAVLTILQKDNCIQIWM